MSLTKLLLLGIILSFSGTSFAQQTWSANGHAYLFVYAQDITWSEANAAASKSCFNGKQGYLVTITSAAENEFVTKISKRYIADKNECKYQSAWIGASDGDEEGSFKWVTGPEAGLQFWSGGQPGAPVGGNYSNWRNGVPDNATPPGNENYVHFDPYPANGTWNDLPNNPVVTPGTASVVSGYVIEYGDIACGVNFYSNSQYVTICKNGDTKSIPCLLVPLYAAMGYTIGVSCQNIECPVTPPPPPPCNLTATVVGSNIKCKGENNGSINVTVTGGTAPYTYKWNTGATSQDLSNLCPGTYCVKIKDSKNCTFEKCVTITEPEKKVSGSLTVTPKYNEGQLYTLYLGYGPTSLKLVAEGSGGTPPYTYTWSPTTNMTGSASNTKYVSPTTTTKYTVTIKDATGCKAYKYVTVKVIDVRCQYNKVVLCKNYREVCVSQSQVYSYLCNGYSLGECKDRYDDDDNDCGDDNNWWNYYGYRTTGQAQEDAFNGVPSPDDAREKSAGAPPSAANTNAGKLIPVVSDKPVSVYPNPSSGIVNVQLTGSVNDVIEIRVIQSNGKEVERKKVVLNSSRQLVTFNLTGKGKGIYLVSIISTTGTSTHKLMIN